MDGKSFLSASSISVSVTTTVVTSGRLTSLHGALLAGQEVVRAKSITLTFILKSTQ